jgi:hypothetical protein
MAFDAALSRDLPSVLFAIADLDFAFKLRVLELVS